MDALKQDLATCIRMLERQGIIDFNGHCSIRLPGDRLLINTGSCRRSRVVPGDMLVIDHSGAVLKGEGKPPLEFHLHVGIYRARADVGAIVHAHPRWSTYLTMTGHAYAPVFAQGALLHPVPVLPTPRSINTPEMALRLAATLGDRPAALLASHGAVTVGAGIVDAFVLAVYLEENAERQYHALQIGKPYVFGDEDCAEAAAKLMNRALFRRTWDHFAAKLPPMEEP
jgi:ribulose-5-phosphate 4-epimerase/fuculose-1-phosphate aldolase